MKGLIFWLTAVVGWMYNITHRLVHFNTLSQSVVLFGKVMELLEGGASLCPRYVTGGRGRVFRFYSLARPPVLSAFCMWVKCDLPASYPAFPAMVDCNLARIISQNKSVLPQTAFCNGVLLQASRWGICLPSTLKPIETQLTIWLQKGQWYLYTVR